MRSIRLRLTHLMSSSNIFFPSSRRFIDEDEKFRWLLDVEMLLNMCHELKEWLSLLLPDENLEFNLFFENLKDGVILCKLANILQGYSDSRVSNIKAKIMGYQSHCMCAKDKSGFHARCNIATFLKWCEYKNVSQTILFDTKDCFESETRGRRQVVICLWYIAKLFKQFGAPVPKLVDFEITRNNKYDFILTYLEYKSKNLQSFNIYETMKEQMPDMDIEDYKKRSAKEQAHTLQESTNTKNCAHSSTLNNIPSYSNTETSKKYLTMINNIDEEEIGKVNDSSFVKQMINCEMHIPNIISTDIKFVNNSIINLSPITKPILVEPKSQQLKNITFRFFAKPLTIKN
ncbi:hypothetical protein MXB_2232 [Myxobolus squamalis]|nr:hypothetical protein MXB_2232 [Myxobolus squamalis]